MSKNYAKFYASNGKRQILIVDDEEKNLLFLYNVLRNEYDIVSANNGEDALKKIKQYEISFSLILLDLNMPKMGGLEVLDRIKNSPELKHIPVIMMTSDQSAEEECLRLGANDFIPKPYPYSGVICARVQRLIEMYETQDLISSTERDSLTGLYTRDYFIRFAEQFDIHHKTLPMDALVININRFHIYNERFGFAYGDKIIKLLGDALHILSIEMNGIVCRRIVDFFLFYCPHIEDTQAFYDDIVTKMKNDSNNIDPPQTRIGIYPNVNKKLSMIERFSRAKTACDVIKRNPQKYIEVYDDDLYNKHQYNERLLAEFQAALREKQFVVYFQPKYDIRYDKPILSGAEALVRWIHPELGFISPADFIPLLEDNGLILSLDRYVWDAAAKQIRVWKDELGVSVPVSVNMSRIDMYDPNVVNFLLEIIKNYNLSTDDLVIEITESAYAQDYEQIFETVKTLRLHGFKMEMDDFGTGYSSLNMLSSLPIDALKLDMQLVQNAFATHTDTRILETIIDIAAYLSIPVISEGVETSDQLSILRALGCDYVQGYFFSKPVPADDFKRFLVELSEENDLSLSVSKSQKISQRKISFAKVAGALFSDCESIFCVDLLTGHYVEYHQTHSRHQLRHKQAGDSFFDEVFEMTKAFMSPEDRKRFGEVLANRNEVIEKMKEKPFSMIYRLALNGEPTWYNLKAVLSKDGNSMVVGIFSIDEAFQGIGALK
ncbi:MAG: EAL domain-containing protein [Clostridia bacterium]|nr:EAL domain-containing protein [Clostridia bacterium]